MMKRYISILFLFLQLGIVKAEVFSTDALTDFSNYLKSIKDNNTDILITSGNVVPNQMLGDDNALKVLQLSDFSVSNDEGPKNPKTAQFINASRKNNAVVIETYTAEGTTYFRAFFKPTTNARMQQNIKDLCKNFKAQEFSFNSQNGTAYDEFFVYMKDIMDFYNGDFVKPNIDVLDGKQFILKNIYEPIKEYLIVIEKRINNPFYYLYDEASTAHFKKVKPDMEAYNSRIYYDLINNNNFNIVINYNDDLDDGNLIIKLLKNFKPNHNDSVFEILSKRKLYVHEAYHALQYVSHSLDCFCRGNVCGSGLTNDLFDEIDAYKIASDFGYALCIANKRVSQVETLYNDFIMQDKLSLESNLYKHLHPLSNQSIPQYEINQNITLNTIIDDNIVNYFKLHNGYIETQKIAKILDKKFPSINFFKGREIKDYVDLYNQLIAKNQMAGLSYISYYQMKKVVNVLPVNLSIVYSFDNFKTKQTLKKNDELKLTSDKITNLIFRVNSPNGYLNPSPRINYNNLQRLNFNVPAYLELQISHDDLISKQNFELSITLDGVVLDFKIIKESSITRTGGNTVNSYLAILKNVNSSEYRAINNFDTVSTFPIEFSNLKLYLASNYSLIPLRKTFTNLPALQSGGKLTTTDDDGKLFSFTVKDDGIAGSSSGDTSAILNEALRLIVNQFNNEIVEQSVKLINAKNYINQLSELNLQKIKTDYKDGMKSANVFDKLRDQVKTDIMANQRIEFNSWVIQNLSPVNANIENIAALIQVFQVNNMSYKDYESSIATKPISEQVNLVKNALLEYFEYVRIMSVR